MHNNIHTFFIRFCATAISLTVFLSVDGGMGMASGNTHSPRPEEASRSLDQGTAPNATPIRTSRDPRITHLLDTGRIIRLRQTARTMNSSSGELTGDQEPETAVLIERQACDSTHQCRITHHLHVWSKALSGMRRIIRTNLSQTPDQRPRTVKFVDGMIVVRSIHHLGSTPSHSGCGVLHFRIYANRLVPIPVTGASLTHESSTCVPQSLPIQTL